MYIDRLLELIKGYEFIYGGALFGVCLSLIGAIGVALSKKNEAGKKLTNSEALAELKKSFGDDAAGVVYTKAQDTASGQREVVFTIFTPHDLDWLL
jgi:hypothetical protein